LRQLLAERDQIIDVYDRRLLDLETKSVQTDEDTTFVNVISTISTDQQQQTDCYQKEINEKNRTIKTLQQRYNDLRKTLQREFHVASSSVPNDLNQIMSSASNHLPQIHYDNNSGETQSDVDSKKSSSSRTPTIVAANSNNTRKNVTFNTTSPAIIPHTTTTTTINRPTTSSTRSHDTSHNSINGTNFKYLKHVVLKFMTSTEDEAIHLIRAVSTLLSFSTDEERLLRETLDYKMSWFGKMAAPRPKIKS